MGQIGGIDVNVWAGSGREVFEGGPIENLLVVIVEGKEAAAERGSKQPQEIPGTESPEEQGPLNVFL